MTMNSNGFILNGMTNPITYQQAVAAELRAEMARQQKTVTDLADALNLERQAARKRYDGTKPMTVSEVDLASAWLDVDRSQLLGALQAVAS